MKFFITRGFVGSRFLRAIITNYTSNELACQFAAFDSLLIREVAAGGGGCLHAMEYLEWVFPGLTEHRTFALSSLRDIAHHTATHEHVLHSAFIGLA